LICDEECERVDGEEREEKEDRDEGHDAEDNDGDHNDHEKDDNGNEEGSATPTCVQPAASWSSRRAPTA